MMLQLLVERPDPLVPEHLDDVHQRAVAGRLGDAHVEQAVAVERLLAVAPLALEYMAGETGVLTLLATAGAAGCLLYRLGRQRGAAQQLAPRAEVKV